MKKRITFHSVFLILILCVFTNLLFRYNDSYIGLGGTVIFFWLIPPLIFLSFVYEPLSAHIDYFVITILGVMFLNYQGYIEMRGMAKLEMIDYSLWIWPPMLLLILFAKSAFCLLQQLEPFEPLTNFNKTTGSKLFIALSCPGIISIIMIALTMPVPQLSHPFNKSINCSTVHFSLIILGLGIGLWRLYLLSDSEIQKHIRQNGIFGKTRLNTVKAILLWCFAVIVLLGSIAETVRGLGVLWIETILILGIMLIMFWKLYKNTNTLIGLNKVKEL